MLPEDKAQTRNVAPTVARRPARRPDVNAIVLPLALVGALLLGAGVYVLFNATNTNTYFGRSAAVDSAVR